MDINDLIFSDTAKMTVTDHRGEPMKTDDGEPMVIEFFSDDTDERLRAFSTYRRNLIAADKDDDLMLEAECKLLGDLTHRLHGVIFNGQEVTLKDAPEMYRKVSKIRMDAMAFVGDASNFIKGHSSN